MTLDRQKPKGKPKCEKIEIATITRSHRGLHFHYYAYIYFIYIIYILLVLFTCPCCWADLCQHLVANKTPIPTRRWVPLPGTKYWHDLAVKEFLLLLNKNEQIEDHLCHQVVRYKGVVYDVGDYRSVFISPALKVLLDSWCFLQCSSLLLHGCWFLICTCNRKSFF